MERTVFVKLIDEEGGPVFGRSGFGKTDGAFIETLASWLVDLVFDKLAELLPVDLSKTVFYLVERCEKILGASWETIRNNCEAWEIPCVGKRGGGPRGLRGDWIGQYLERCMTEENRELAAVA